MESQRNTSTELDSNENVASRKLGPCLGGSQDQPTQLETPEPMLWAATATSHTAG